VGLPLLLKRNFSSADLVRAFSITGALLPVCVILLKIGPHRFNLSGRKQRPPLQDDCWRRQVAAFDGVPQSPNTDFQGSCGSSVGGTVPFVKIFHKCSKKNAMMRIYTSNEEENI
jgi:hypothetical protein